MGPTIVTPAKAGIQKIRSTHWMPAFAGMTENCLWNRSDQVFDFQSHIERIGFIYTYFARGLQKEKARIVRFALSTQDEDLLSQFSLPRADPLVAATPASQHGQSIRSDYSGPHDQLQRQFFHFVSPLSLEIIPSLSEAHSRHSGIWIEQGAYPLEKEGGLHRQDHEIAHLFLKAVRQLNMLHAQCCTG